MNKQRGPIRVASVAGWGLLLSVVYNAFAFSLAQHANGAEGLNLLFAPGIALTILAAALGVSTSHVSPVFFNIPACFVIFTFVLWGGWFPKFALALAEAARNFGSIFRRPD
jgi:hypothetical protein